MGCQAKPLQTFVKLREPATTGAVAPSTTLDQEAVLKDIPPNPRARGMNVLMLLILLILIGGAAAWGFLENPSQAPAPSAGPGAASLPGGS